jgi:transposase
MGRQAKQMKQARKKYSPEFRKEALGLASKVGVAEAARQLDLYESQIYGWRTKSMQKVSTTATENQLAVENAQLKRRLAERDEEVAILKKAAAYFAKNQK